MAAQAYMQRRNALRGRLSTSQVILPGDASTGFEARTLEQKLLDIPCVLDYGVKGDGETDDTVKLQAAIDRFCVDGGALLWPAAAAGYLITDKLILPARKNYALETFGMVKIMQATDNTGILEFGPTDDIARVRLGDFYFEWATNQTAADTNSVGLKFSSALTHNCEFGELNFINGYRGISIPVGAGPSWGCQWKKVFGSQSMTGSLIHLVQVEGKPGHVFHDIYGRGDSLTEPMVSCVQGSLTIGKFEANILAPSMQMMLLDTCRVSFDQMIFEQGEYAADEALISMQSTRFNGGYFEAQNFTVNAPGGHAFLFADTAGSGSRIDIALLETLVTVVTSGTPALCYSPVGLGNESYVFGDALFDHAAWDTASAAVNGARATTRVLAWELERISTNAASPVTCTMEGASTFRWTTALTADITVNLPTKRFVANKRLRYIRAAGCTGAFNINIRNADGSTVLHTLSAEKQEIEVAHTTSSTNGWYVARNGTLP